MSEQPIVSVVMAVYNDSQYLRESISSVLSQTLGDIEFIVVDDGSSDDTGRLVEQYAKIDPRVKLITNESNLGLASSLNRGIRLSRGEFIARMDADDICMPTRLEKQVNFLHENPAVGMCGVSAKLFGYRWGLWRIPADHEEIRASLLFYNPICHPSVMYRRSEFLAQGVTYEDGRRRAEDLELWSRLVETMKVANLQEKLIKYRLHNPANLAKREAVVSHGNEIRYALLQRLLGKISEDEFALHMKMVRCERNASAEFLDEAGRWLESILDANMREQIYDDAGLSKAVSYRWWRVCKASSELGPRVLSVFYSRYRLTRYNPGFARRVLMWLKCLMWHKTSAKSVHDVDLAYICKLPDAA